MRGGDDGAYPFASRGDGQYTYGGPWMFQNDILAGLIAARSSANRLYLAAKPGSAIETLLDGADALAAIVEDWARTPANNAVVVEPAA
jgi:hypothetical protein